MLLRWLPKSAYGILHEVTRHVLKRPVIAVVAIGRTKDGQYLLIRRADNGMWCFPGGTLEWGETLRAGLARELEEEAGVTTFTVERVLGAWSDPSRDPRFHAVTIGVVCSVEPPMKPPLNPLEIREVRLFDEADIPAKLAFRFEDLLLAARSPGTVLE